MTDSFGARLHMVPRWSAWHADPAQWQRALDADLGLRGLTLRRLAWTAIVIMLFTMSSALANAVAADGGWPAARTIVRYMRPFAAQYTAWMLPALLAGILGDRATVTGLRRAAVVFLALLVAGQVSIVLQDLLLDNCDTSCRPFWSAAHLREYAEYGFDITIHTCAIAMVYYAQRRDTAVAAALRASELARADAERERLSSALQTMQARIDPAFLLDALGEVGLRYARQSASGGRLLDLLIAYLRAALPCTGEVTSTIRREMTLLRTFLDIAALRSDGRLALECSDDEALHGAALPPLTLVPLAGSIPHDAASGTVRLALTGIDRRARVSVDAQGDVAAALAPASAIAETRERLRAFYGERATLMLDRRDPRSLQLILEVPT